MRKMLNEFSLVFVLFFCCSGAKAQDVKSENNPKGEKLAYTFLLFKECQCIGDFMVRLPGKKTFDEKGQLLSQEFRNKSSFCEYGALGLTPIYYIHLAWQNGNVNALYTSNNICYENFEKITILNGKIWNILVNASYYYFIYDTVNRLIRINEGREFDYYGKTDSGKKDWRKNYYTFDYFPSGAIKMIKSFVSIGEGDDKQFVKELYAYVQEERHYMEHEANKVRIVRFEKKRNRDENDIVGMDVTVECKQEAEKEEFLKINNLKVEPISYKYVSEFNSVGQVTRVLTLKNNNELINVSENKYDNQGVLNKTSHGSFSRDGRFFVNTEHIYNYTFKQSSDPKDQCSYAPDMEIKNYNEKGELASEIKNGKARAKKANGEWGPWTLKY